MGLALLVAWDLSGFDLPVERLFGTAQGFAFRNTALAIGLYDAGRAVAWIVVPLLIASLSFRVPVISRVARSQRAWWLLTTVACLVLVPMLRGHSATSCPWSLTEFGGTAPYVSHWWRASDLGPGRCFPSGHASTGFAFFAGFLALREVDRRAASWWLAGAVAIGLLAAATQTVRGAHFVSHSLWTAWICWTVTVASFHATRSALKLVRRRSATGSDLQVQGYP
ncbi:MAG: superfamily protein [Rhizobacter sp.]|nr:superfamily protein [Rhizobacter sp.]